MQLEAICAVHDIQKVSIWSRSIKNAERFVAEISGNMNINVYKNISDAVSEALSQKYFCSIEGFILGEFMPPVRRIVQK